MPRPSADAASDESSMGASLVRSLLERHGIAKHRQSSFVGEFFQLSRAAAYRRVHGTAAWTLEDLERLTVHFGESLGKLFAVKSSPPGTPAVMRLANLTAACRIWLDAKAAPKPHDLFAVVEEEGRLVVVPTAHSKAEGQMRLVKLELDQSDRRDCRVAVLDEERRVSDSICQQLRQQGFDAQAFHDAQSLNTAIAAESFDAYVLDWLPQEGATEELMKKIRDRTPPSSIVVLTGRVRDPAYEERILDATLTYTARLCEKPVRISHVVTALRAGSRLRI